MKPVQGYCGKHRQIVTWLPSGQACKLCGVCRQTVANWMTHGWVHALTLPSSRWLVCELSLRTARRPAADSRPKKPVQNGKFGEVRLLRV